MNKRMIDKDFARLITSEIEPKVHHGLLLLCGPADKGPLGIIKEATIVINQMTNEEINNWFGRDALLPSGLMGMITTVRLHLDMGPVSKYLHAYWKTLQTDVVVPAGSFIDSNSSVGQTLATKIIASLLTLIKEDKDLEEISENIGTARVGQGLREKIEELQKAAQQREGVIQELRSDAKKKKASKKKTKKKAEKQKEGRKK